MNRSFRLFAVLAALAAAALFPATSGAVITGTAHEVGTATSPTGPCAACHIPHGGGAQRLWPAGTGSGTYVGAVAPLCASCHHSTGGYSGTMGAAQSDGYVYHSQSHGSLMNVTNLPPSTVVTNSNLPYAAQTNNFECTTCHNVHDDTIRPFMRETLDAICARCHTNRHYVNNALQQGSAVTTGAWGLTNVGTANPGSHPIGTDITGDVSGGASPIAIPTIMNVVRSATVNGWVLGGKTMANGLGVTCVTCHAVHGAQADAQTSGGNQPAAAASPNANFLALAQAGGTITGTNGSNGRVVANGNGGYNALCEGCHGSNVVGTVAQSSAFKVNPGANAAWTHPVDDYPSVNNAGVTAFGTNWPVGGTAGGGPAAPGTNVSPMPICESCHGAHPTADIARSDYVAGAADYILRAPTTSFCSGCHTGAGFAGHHPVGMTYNSTGITAYLNNATGAANDTLTCQTCHNGAHNWTSAGFPSLPAGWLPSNNGRSTTRSTDMYNTNMSKTCMDCHYGMDGHRASVSPTLGSAATVTVEAEYQKANQSMGTHYIGLIHNPGAAATWKGDGTGQFIVPRVDIFSTTALWNAGTGMSAVAGPGYSRFGGTSTSPVLVCESCHTLRPAYSVNGTNRISHLLLAQSTEGSNGDDLDSDGRDQFCEACHGVPNNTHAQTGFTVSRTGATLNTTATWLRGTILGDATMTATGNKLSCDSCHQVHDANSNSYTFILDAPSTITIGTFTGNPVGAGTVDSGNPSVTTEYPLAAGSVLQYATPTLSGRGGNFTAYCDQCHVYAY